LAKRSINPAEVEKVAEQIKGNYDSVAICFINSYINAENEEKAAELFREKLGSEVMIITSSETAREWREYERTSTAVLNAYVSPITKAHLIALNKELNKRGFKGNLYIMQSNGGVMKDDLAIEKGVQILMSGPVGGAIGGTGCGRKNVIGIDMGGTSFDVSLIVDGQTEITVESIVEGFPALVPTVNIFSIGAGGGSIAWEEGGGMRVGPQSAGATPGHFCWGDAGTGTPIHPGIYCDDSRSYHSTGLFCYKCGCWCRYRTFRCTTHPLRFWFCHIKNTGFVFTCVHEYGLVRFACCSCGQCRFGGVQHRLHIDGKFLDLCVSYDFHWFHFCYSRIERPGNNR